MQVSSVSPTDVIDRFQRALNDHDLDAFLECFHEDYEAFQPLYPTRNFRGRDQVKKNWSTNFENVPDIHARRLRSVEDGDTFWTEWEWTGTEKNGQKVLLRGVTLFGVCDGRFAWGKLYVDDVKETEEPSDE